MDSFEINHSVGTVAAFLTAFEFLCSTVSAFSVRAAIHGVWLLYLHKHGAVRMDEGSRMRRVVLKDFFAFMLGIWIVICVGLVESNLQPTVHVHDEETNLPDICVPLNRTIHPYVMASTVPPFRVIVEPWVLSVAKTLNCGDKGIATIGTGGVTDITGQKINMTAPICSRKQPVPIGSVFTNVSKLFVSDNSLQFPTYESTLFEMLPYSNEGLGMLFNKVTFPTAEGTGTCGEKGISLFSTYITALWSTTYANSVVVATQVLKMICREHGDKAIEPLPLASISTCINRDQELIDVGCVQETVDGRKLNRVNLANMTGLFVGNISYACVNSTIRINYVFLHPNVMKELKPLLNISLPVVLPIRVNALDGYCERSMSVLARGALIYTADSQWRSSELIEMSVLGRYYAYLIAISSSQFPLKNINPFGPKQELECLLHVVSEVTKVPIDWRFYLLIAGLSVACLTWFFGIIFRCVYRGETWYVGSANWSISHLLRRTQRSSMRGAVIEVVPTTNAAAMAAIASEDQDDEVITTFRTIPSDGFDIEINSSNLGSLRRRQSYGHTRPRNCGGYMYRLRALASFTERHGQPESLGRSPSMRLQRRRTLHGTISQDSCGV